jgi:hypothetical protein
LSSNDVEDGAEYKDLDEPLADFIKRKGGVNKCGAVCPSPRATIKAATILSDAVSALSNSP